MEEGESNFVDNLVSPSLSGVLGVNHYWFLVY